MADTASYSGAMKIKYPRPPRGKRSEQKKHRRAAARYLRRRRPVDY